MGSQSSTVLLPYQSSGQTVLINNQGPPGPAGPPGTGGGSSLTPTAVKTANYTAAASDLVPVDTTSGNITITLPTAPADKTQVGAKHVIRGGTNTVTIACGGSDVINKAGGVTSMTLTLLAQGAVLQYKASTSVWYVVSDDLALAQLDLRFAAIGAGGAGLPANIVSKTSAYTAAAGDFIEGDTSTAGFTITLPAAPATGALVAVKKISSDGNTLTITPSGGGTIDGDPNGTTTTQWAGAVFEHKGSNVWRVAASMTTTGPAGPTGPMGPAGSTGATGPTGATGSAGAGGTDQRLTSGRWTFPLVAAGVNTGFATDAKLVAYQLNPGNAGAINALVGAVSTAGSSGTAKLRLGIYSDAADYPNALLYDSGQLDAGVPGQPISTLGSPVSVTGPVWLAVVYQGSPATNPVLTMLDANKSFGPRMTQPNTGLNLTAAGQWGLAYSTTGVTGALPSTFPAGATVERANTTAYLPLVAAKAV